MRHFRSRNSSRVKDTIALTLIYRFSCCPEAKGTDVIVPFSKMAFIKRGQYGDSLKRNRTKLLILLVIFIVIRYFGFPHFRTENEGIRVNKDIRIISINKRDSLQPHVCIYCNDDYDCHFAKAETEIHSDNFGFPFGASDVRCKGVNTEYANHVTLSTSTDTSHVYKAQFLPIKNRKEEHSFKYRFTVCISNLFGNYNNVLQFAQTMELYKLLGVEHVVIYNTSCGPHLEKLLQNYEKEEILEIVPWPIDKYLKPSSGWNFTLHGGDLHYYGQLVTLNECIYRHMYQSEYILLNDIDEIIMPYKYPNLQLLMEDLQTNNKDVGVFRIENHIFPKTKFENRHMFRRPEWDGIPGINIMEHIYREPDRKRIYNPTKMIVNPRVVIQTSVHSTLKHTGNEYLVPFDVCRIVHVRTPLQSHLAKNECFVDTRVWDFKKKLLPNVDRVLQASGLLKIPN
ncbi:beta-1,4-galactosyltransferase galt-1-like isoform X2 [Brachyhypopomus gauderio]|uniref:beta-1,4-galactosyltransferase galt-1-like isoform X2 n=1 Tax=Brachyhypopomus gauderio TaxID=698409 RepID=UPI0040416217